MDRSLLNPMDPNSTPNQHTMHLHMVASPSSISLQEGMQAIVPRLPRPSRDPTRASPLPPPHRRSSNNLTGQTQRSPRLLQLEPIPTLQL